MVDKVLRVEEVKADIIGFWGEPSLRSPACLDKLISAVRREERERAVKLIQEVGENNPYPRDVFTEKSKEEWKKFHGVLAKEGLCGDGYCGCVARFAFDVAIQVFKKKMEEE